MITELNKGRFSGFAQRYDEFRFIPPIGMLRKIVTIYGKNKDIILADIGCGTGLSTFIWESYSRKIIGIEINDDMLAEAKRKLEELETGNITFVRGESSNMPISDNEIDVITCSQSFHWMEPETTLLEFHRVLSPGGLLLIYDYDWPPTVNNEIEKIYNEIMKETVYLLQTRRSDAKQWPKNEHLKNITKSDLFAFQKEIVFHEEMKLNYKEFIGLIESQGSIQNAKNINNHNYEKALEAAKKKIGIIFNDTEMNGIISYRMRLGIK